MAHVIIDCAIYRKGHREETSHEPGALADVIAALDETDLSRSAVEELVARALPG